MAMHYGNGLTGGAVTGAVNVPYVQVTNVAPKEIGLMDRAMGLHGGLVELRSRLENFGGRVLGTGIGVQGNDQPPVVGLPAALSLAEAELRQCLSLLNELSDRF